MKEEIAWSYSMSDEIWQGGPCDNIIDCITEAEFNSMTDSDTIAFGYVEPYKVEHVNADSIIEYLQEDAYEQIGEVAQDWLDNITVEQRKDLEASVLSVVKDWLKRCKEEPSFYKVLPFEELTLGEAKKKYNENYEI